MLTLLILAMPFRGFSQIHNSITWPAMAVLPPATATINTVTTVSTSPFVLNNPQGVTVDGSGNLFIVDWGYPTGIRKVAVDTGLITTVAGVDKPELGDNGPATGASFYYPYGITLDTRGNLFIADSANLRIRAIRGPIP